MALFEERNHRAYANIVEYSVADSGEWESEDESANQDESSEGEAEMDRPYTAEELETYLSFEKEEKDAVCPLPELFDTSDEKNHEANAAGLTADLDMAMHHSADLASLLLMFHSDTPGKFRLPSTLYRGKLLDGNNVEVSIPNDLRDQVSGLRCIPLQNFRNVEIATLELPNHLQYHLYMCCMTARSPKGCDPHFPHDWLSTVCFCFNLARDQKEKFKAYKNLIPRWKDRYNNSMGLTGKTTVKGGLDREQYIVYHKTAVDYQVGVAFLMAFMEAMHLLAFGKMGNIFEEYHEDQVNFGLPKEVFSAINYENTACIAREIVSQCHFIMICAGSKGLVKTLTTLDINCSDKKLVDAAIAQQVSMLAGEIKKMFRTPKRDETRQMKKHIEEFFSHVHSYLDVGLVFDPKHRGVGFVVRGPQTARVLQGIFKMHPIDIKSLFDKALTDATSRAWDPIQPKNDKDGADSTEFRHPDRRYKLYDKSFQKRVLLGDDLKKHGWDNGLGPGDTYPPQATFTDTASEYSSPFSKSPGTPFSIPAGAEPQSFMDDDEEEDAVAAEDSELYMNTIERLVASPTGRNSRTGRNSHTARTQGVIDLMSSSDEGSTASPDTTSIWEGSNASEQQQDHNFDFEPSPDESVLSAEEESLQRNQPIATARTGYEEFHEEDEDFYEDSDTEESIAPSNLERAIDAMRTSGKMKKALDVYPQLFTGGQIGNVMSGKKRLELGILRHRVVDNQAEVMQREVGATLGEKTPNVSSNVVGGRCYTAELRTAGYRQISPRIVDDGRNMKYKLDAILLGNFGQGKEIAGLAKDIRKKGKRLYEAVCSLESTMSHLEKTRARIELTFSFKGHFKEEHLDFPLPENFNICSTFAAINMAKTTSATVRELQYCKSVLQNSICDGDVASLVSLKAETKCAVMYFVERTLLALGAYTGNFPIHKAVTPVCANRNLSIQALQYIHWAPILRKDKQRTGCPYALRSHLVNAEGNAKRTRLDKFFDMSYKQLIARELTDVLSNQVRYPYMYGLALGCAKQALCRPKQFCSNLQLPDDQQEPVEVGRYDEVNVKELSELDPPGRWQVMKHFAKIFLKMYRIVFTYHIKRVFGCTVEEIPEFDLKCMQSLHNWFRHIRNKRDKDAVVDGRVVEKCE